MRLTKSRMISWTDWETERTGGGTSRRPWLGSPSSRPLWARQRRAGGGSQRGRHLLACHDGGRCNRRVGRLGFCRRDRQGTVAVTGETDLASSAKLVSKTKPQAEPGISQGRGQRKPNYVDGRCLWLLGSPCVTRGRSVLRCGRATAAPARRFPAVPSRPGFGVAKMPAARSQGRRRDEDGCLL